MKLTVNDHHQNTSLKLDSEGNLLSAYLHLGSDHNSNQMVLRKKTL